MKTTSYFKSLSHSHLTLMVIIQNHWIVASAGTVVLAKVANVVHELTSPPDASCCDERTSIRTW